MAGKTDFVASTEEGVEGVFMSSFGRRDHHEVNSFSPRIQKGRVACGGGCANAAQKKKGAPNGTP